MSILIYNAMTVGSDLERHLSRLSEAVETGLSRCRAPLVFFRADDIGPPGKNVFRMMDLFLKYKVPLCLAVVPAWLTPVRWEAMAGRAQEAGALFCWHQHGWRHRNHETRGKKQEFGPARSPGEILRDLESGKNRLDSIMGSRFSPFFTPPWNRCSSETLGFLASGGFRGVSRSRGSLPPAPEGLAVMDVTVDLHTRKETSPDQGWEALYAELAQGLASGLCGIMLHHNQMNEGAFIFLEFLLARIVEYKTLSFITFDNR
ncbi:MAG: polysaccharide deacetylase family protein [Pseudomonadota bacterium]